MTDPKVSIIIPVYNGSDYLGEAIDSALAQSYKNIEVLVVNDGSNDGGKTERIAKLYGTKVRYFFKDNGGVASALNLAIAEMSGEYFSWLSHDDLYDEEKVEKEINVLSRVGGDVVVYSNYSVFTSDAENVTPVSLKGVPPENFRYWITVENRLHGCTLLIPRSAFEKVGVFNESLRTTQDYDLWFRMAKEFSFIHTPEILVKARSHMNQGSHKMAGIALAECNSLLSNFVHGLSHQELMSATDKPLAESYAVIASSMFNRGFNEVGILAEDYAKKNGVTINNKVATMRRNMSYIKNRFINIGRKLLPMKVKHVIKTAIRPSMDQTAAIIEKKPEQLKEKFSEVYEKNIFGGRISRSGEGSDLVQTENIRRELPRIVNDFSIETFLDAPCGDWYWMKETNLGVEQYIGIDIVETMIEKHKVDYAGPACTFQCLNLAEDPLPKADLIFSRDCLVHLKFEDAMKIIANFKKSGAKYLLTTTFVDLSENNDLVGKDCFWRPLNMRLAPFNFPDPILTVNEKCTEEAMQYADKSLCLWLLSDITIG